MQSTTNYSMNLVEGTDLVNIPVQLNPNFQTIDQEMFANKQATIGTATEVVTGTVHAVVRANTDADMFRFTATGAWTSGDTMTLDGSAVTVHLADGTAPATGAYIIGAEVVAVVNGTLVTLLTSAAQPVAGVTSFNSRTGAVVPAASDYDGSMIDYDNTGSGLAATDVQSAIDEVVGLIPSGSSGGVKLLWSNPDITTDPGLGYDAPISDTDYDTYIVVCRLSTSSPQQMVAMGMKGQPAICNYPFYYSGFHLRYREFTPTVLGDSIDIGTPQQDGSATGAGNLIPVAIYGLKAE